MRTKFPSSAGYHEVGVLSRGLLNVTLLARTPLEDIFTVNFGAGVEITCVEVRVEQSVAARDVRAIDTLHLLHLHLLEEVNGADEISISGKPLDDRRGMPLRCRLTAPQLRNFWKARHTRR